MVSLKERLTDILVKDKLISEENLKKALKTHKEKGGNLGNTLVSMNFINEDVLLAVLSRSLGFPPIDVSRLTIDPEVIKLLPYNLARHYQMVPISIVGDTLTVVMADPLNILAIDDVKSLTGYKMNPIIAKSGQLNEVIENSYRGSLQDMIENIIKDVDESQIEVLKEEEQKSLGASELMHLSQEGPVVRFTDSLLEKAIKARASDIFIEPLEKTMRIRLRVDGTLRQIDTPGKSIYAPLISRIKVISNLNIAEHRLPQDGRFKVKFKDHEVDFRVAIIPSSLGEKVALRVLDKQQAVLNLDKLGFEENTLDTLRKCSLKPHGMILVCGPTGSGKTTTLYSILKFVDSSAKNIVTVEDPIEYQLEGINQVNANFDIGLTFASSLRSILRQDPDIIMIGEIRDFETVDIAIKAALTGHLVLSTVHTTTSAGSIVRLVDMGVEPFLINSSLIAIVAQRLLRKACPFCSEKYKVADDLVKRFKLKNNFLSRSKGCRRCFNTGYLGRIAIAENLVVTPKIRQLILERGVERNIKDIARQEGMRTLREEGMAKVIKGETTLEEVLRITAPDE